MLILELTRRFLKLGDQGLQREGDATIDVNKYIIVVSKWPEAYAIRNQEGMTVAKTLLDNWIARFGVPVELHSDQGRNLESNQRVTEVLRIRET